MEQPGGGGHPPPDHHIGRRGEPDAVKSAHNGHQESSSGSYNYDQSESVSLPLVKEGKRIVVVGRKFNAVTQLSAYWHVKGVLTNMKYDPKLLNDVNALRTVVDYIENHTKLAQLTFWTKLTMDQKIQACKSIVLYEDTSNELQIWLSARKSELFLLLSGEAATIESDGKEVNRAHGDVFGNLEQFECIYNKDASEKFMLSAGNKKANPYRLNRCTFIRLSYDDLLNKIVSPPVAPPNFLAMEEALPANEQLLRRVQRSAKEALSAEVFEFLSNNGVIASSATAKEFDFIHTANINRDVVLSKKDCNKIFILIEGAVKFEISKVLTGNSTENSKQPNLICSHKGDKGMAISLKRSTMPLMLVGIGSIFSLQANCFNVGKADALPGSLSQSSRGASRKKKRVADTKDLYSIRMFFESDSIYLCIPEEVLRTHLRTLNSNSPLTTFIRTQINQINTSIFDRVNYFYPWVIGNINWKLPKDPDSDLKTSADSNDASSNRETSLSSSNRGIISRSLTLNSLENVTFPKL